MSNGFKTIDEYMNWSHYYELKKAVYLHNIEYLVSRMNKSHYGRAK